MAYDPWGMQAGALDPAEALREQARNAAAIALMGQQGYDLGDPWQGGMGTEPGPLGAPMDATFDSGAREQGPFSGPEWSNPPAPDPVSPAPPAPAPSPPSVAPPAVEQPDPGRENTVTVNPGWEVVDNVSIAPPDVNVTPTVDPAPAPPGTMPAGPAPLGGKDQSSFGPPGNVQPGYDQNANRTTTQFTTMTPQAYPPEYEPIGVYSPLTAAPPPGTMPAGPLPAPYGTTAPEGKTGGRVGFDDQGRPLPAYPPPLAPISYEPPGFGFGPAGAYGSDDGFNGFGPAGGGGFGFGFGPAGGGGGGGGGGLDAGGYGPDAGGGGFGYGGGGGIGGGVGGGGPGTGGHESGHADSQGGFGPSTSGHEGSHGADNGPADYGGGNTDDGTGASPGVGAGGTGVGDNPGPGDDEGGTGPSGQSTGSSDDGQNY